MSELDFEFYERETYRAIGRYVVEFSQLIGFMRTIIADRFDTDPIILGDLMLGEANPNQIANVFFGVCQILGDFDNDEQKVASRLRKRVVVDEIERRNDIAHGDWFIDIARRGDIDIGSSQVVRIRPMRKDGAFKTMEVTADQLDEWSDSVVTLRRLVIEFGAVSLGNPLFKSAGARVRDIFVMRNGEVVREGPRADEFPPFMG